MNKARTVLLLCCVAMLVSCADSSSEKDGGAVATVNSLCPMMGEPVGEGETVTYAGQTIGFCCEGCAPKFAKLSDAEKIAKLAAVGVKLPE